MKQVTFETVEFWYGSYMFEPMMAAKRSIEEEGLQIEGFDITTEGNKTKITISIEQKENFLIQFGIRVGKLLK